MVRPGPVLHGLLHAVSQILLRGRYGFSHMPSCWSPRRTLMTKPVDDNNPPPRITAHAVDDTAPVRGGSAVRGLWMVCIFVLGGIKFWVTLVGWEWTAFKKVQRIDVSARW